MLAAGTAVIDMGSDKPLRGRHDVLIVVQHEKPIYAHALALKAQDTLVVIICCDICGFDPRFATQAEKNIAQSLNIPPGHVILYGTHSHCGPCMRLFYEQVAREEKLGLLNQAWHDQLAEKLLTIALQAAGKLQEVTIAGGIGEIHGIASNRRIKMPDGSYAHRGSLGPAHLRQYPEGNIDPMVRSLFFLDQGGRAAAVFYNYSCHASSLGGGQTYQINPDYPGYAEDQIKQSLGQDTCCLYGMGAAGNINTGKYIKGKNGQRDTQEVAQMSKILSGEVIRQFNQIKQGTAIKQLGLEAQIKYFEADRDLIPDLNQANQELSAAVEHYRSVESSTDQQTLEQAKQRLITAMQDAETARFGQDGKIKVTIRKLTFNDQACILFSSGEYFVDIGKEIFRRSRYPLTYFVSMWNPETLYVPDQQVFDDPHGYGVSKRRRISQQGCKQLAEILWQKVAP